MMINFRNLRKKPVLAYGFGLACFAFALGLRFYLDDALQGYPFVVFFPAIFITAVMAGVGPGLFIGVLSALAAVYFFIPPFYSFSIPSQNNVVAVCFFVLVVVIDLILIGLLNHKIDALDGVNRDRQRLIDYQKILFAELQHRVANNLAFVSSLLALQKRQLEKDSAAAKVLDLAGLRIMAMSQIHRTLHDQASVDQPLSSFLKQLTVDVLKSAGVETVIVDAYGDDVRLDLNRLTTLALLVSELITNSAKHVFHKGLGDRIALHVVRLDGSKVRVEVSDNGPGLPPDLPPASQSDKLGHAIIAGLIKQLDGDYEVVNNKGALAIITFPLVMAPSDA